METGSDAHILIAYFTYGENANLSNGAEVSSSASIQNWNGEVTGNAGVLAHMIHDAIEADLFSIRTVDPYPSTYDETVAQGRSENDADARPTLAVHIENLDQYDTIFIGFPKMEQGYTCVQRCIAQRKEGEQAQKTQQKEKVCIE